MNYAPSGPHPLAPVCATGPVLLLCVTPQHEVFAPGLLLISWPASFTCLGMPRFWKNDD